MKHVEACLSARKDQESSFHYCGSTVDLVQPYICMCGKDLIKPFYLPWRCCEARAGLFKCLERSRKKF